MIRAAVLAALAALLAAADADPRPRQYRIWGTVAPAATDRIVAPAPYQEALPAGFDPGPALPATPELLARGFLPFRHHTQALMHPRLRPGPAGLADPALAGFASIGEYTGLSLGVHATRDLGAVEASIGDLAGPGGARLAAADLELRWVKFLPNPVARFVYRLDPMVLERRRSVAIDAGTSAFIWLTVHLPPGTAPGTYRGSLRLAAPGCPAQEVAVAFRALDLGLQAPDRHLAMLYNFYHNTSATGDSSRMDAEFADMALHGMNSLSYIQLTPPEVAAPGGGTAFDFAAPSRIGAQHGLSIRRILDAARDAGLTRDAVINLSMIYKYGTPWTGHELGTAACDDHLRRLAAAWRSEIAQAQGWPRVMFNIGDEPTARNGRLEPSRRIGAQLKAGAPGIPTTSFCVGGYLGEDDLAVLEPVLDVAVVPVIPTTTYRDSLVKRGKPFWTYNAAKPDKPLTARLAFGWEVLGTGAAGMEQFMYRQVWGCDKERLWESAFLRWPKEGFDNLEPTWCYSWRADDGCLPSPAFEAIRAGVADLAYVETAAALAAQAAADADPARRALGLRAQARLAGLHREFAYFLPNGAFRGCDWLHLAGTELLDLRRWEVARLILELRGGAAIGEHAPGPAPCLAVGEVRCVPAAAPAQGRPLIVAAIGGAGTASAMPFSLLGSVQPAVRQTRFAVRADADALRLDCQAGDDDPRRPQRADGGIFSQDGIEIFLSSPVQAGIVHQVAASALGQVGLLSHRRLDRGHAEQIADRIADPPPGLTARGQRVADGWRLEVTIPYADLGLAGAPVPGEVWGLNICRTRRGAPGVSAEHSAWSPLQGRFLEPAALGRLAIGRDPGVSAPWCEAVGSETEAFAALEVENRGPAPATARFSVGGTTHERTLPPGASRVVLPLGRLTPPCTLPIACDGITVACLAVAGPAAAGLEVAGVGSRRAADAGGTPIRAALRVPGVVWAQARAIPLDFDLPVAGGGLSGTLEVRDQDRLLLHHQLTGLASAQGRLVLAADGLPADHALAITMALGGSSFTTGLRIGDGFLD